MSAHIPPAEDDGGLRTIVADELSAAGFKVEAFANGSFAISALKNNANDLVLLDLRMPCKSGADELKFMQSEHIRTRTIVLTGVEILATTKQTLTLGSNDTILKPFNAAEFIRCISKVLATQNVQPNMEPEKQPITLAALWMLDVFAADHSSLVRSLLSDDDVDFSWASHFSLSFSSDDFDSPRS